MDYGASLVAKLCARSLAEDDAEVVLSEPTFWLPKEHERGDRTIEYRQYHTPERINDETGYIAGGETTSVALAGLP